MSERDTDGQERRWLRRLQALEQENHRHLRAVELREQERLERLAARKATRRLLSEEAIQRLYAHAAALRTEVSALRTDLLRLRASWFYKPFALIRRIEEAVLRRSPRIGSAPDRPDGAAGLRFDIDTLSDCIFRGSGDLSGWCLNLNGEPPRAVRARAGEHVFDGVYGTSRPGIGSGFSNVPGSGNSGFRVHLELPEGTHDVALEALLGRAWREFARIPVVCLAPLAPRCHFWLDAPLGYTVVLGAGEELKISGWCVPGVGGRIHGIRVLMNDTVYVGEHALPRPDVARLLPDVPFAENGGFMINARVAPGRYHGCIQAQDGTGAWQEVAVREWRIVQGIPKLEMLSPSAATASLPPAQVYRDWFDRARAGADALERQRRACAVQTDGPLLSVVIPCYNSPPGWFGELLDSLRVQTYSRFECLIVDDASTQVAHLEPARRMARDDARFRLIERERNTGVGGATRTGADACTGDYVLVADHDDLVEPDALFEIAAAIAAERPDVVYTDEVLADESGQVFGAALRPAFNYDYLLSHPFIVHLTAIRRELVVQAGSYDPLLPVSQDYDLLLRVAALTRRFHHVPKALYRWRIHGASTGHRHAALVMEYSREAIGRHLRLAGRNEAEAWVEDGPVMNSFRVRYLIAPAKVSVIVLAGGERPDAAACLRTFWEHTRFPEGVVTELTLVAPPSAISEDLRRLEYRIVEIAAGDSVAALLNRAVRESSGDYLLFLDADVTVSGEGWLEALMEPLAQGDVAAAGGKLVSPQTGLIEHAGVIVGFDGSAAMEHRGFPESQGGLPFPGHGQGLAAVRECSALSGACLLVRRSAFDQAGGFDPVYRRAFHDYDLTLSLRAQGQRCVFTPHARLFWSGPAPAPDADRAHFAAKWSQGLRAGDPFYNPNLARAGRMFWPAG